ncbi:glucosamine-6-phosphate deaminase [Synechocystis sp. PCC 7509]|uniref:glucosamine-6-phosphate deaminase n=1 Tax=Synechocystis sp. PCC 7509 TaxID=927677 RepID=UPI0002AC3C03|nr:glucosamine-6-phosphate deaminase [Synechocystis sp. PCC 7509]
MFELTTSLHAPVKNFQVDNLTVRLCGSTTLTDDAAKIAQNYLSSLLKTQNQARVILATGNSQLKFLEALIALGGVDWSRVVFFHLDEYLGISPQHPASFRYYLHKNVEKRINAVDFHYIEGDAVEPLAECDRYSQLLQTQPIDLCFLGIGENGHLAFNEPSVASFDETRQIKLVKLEPATRQQQVGEGHFLSVEDVPQYAFTLTIRQICQSRKILCLAPEKRKAIAVKNMLRLPISPTCPASILRQHSQATLFLDSDSASLLGNL